MPYVFMIQILSRDMSHKSSIIKDISSESGLKRLPGFGRTREAFSQTAGCQARRYTSGETPICRRKTLAKELLSEKPTVMAISVTLFSLSRNNILAWLTR